MFILTLAKKVYIKYCCSTVVAVAVSARVTLDDPIIAKAGDRVHTFVRVVRHLSVSCVRCKKRSLSQADPDRPVASARRPALHSGQQRMRQATATAQQTLPRSNCTLASLNRSTFGWVFLNNG
jgi:hypothetical protein